jgi:hypothetical protein
MRKGNSFCLQKDKGKIIKEYKKGVSVANFCEKYHCYRTIVADLLKREGVALHTKRIKRGVLYDFTCEIKSLYEQGKPFKAIAKKYGVTISGVSRFLKNKGWNRSQLDKLESLKGVCNA